MKRIFFTILMMGLFSSAAKALTLVEATNTTITKLTVYSEVDSGTVLIQVSTPPVGCDNGFWLSGTAAGVKHTIS
ncbi:hypothetical protein TW85_21945, partial [Marinomonas sp. S3726]|uniref:hypothetical protein n=1 Tax=Marinomonas sp. S3726 TaxID=579484 RepID=UPI0005FA7295